MTAKEEITLVFRLNSIDIGGVLQRIESVLSNEPKKAAQVFRLPHFANCRDAPPVREMEKI